jgi:hypothetical protein
VVALAYVDKHGRIVENRDGRLESDESIAGQCEKRLPVPS